MKILCIHGIGHQEERIGWRDDWVQLITDRAREWQPAAAPVITQFAYDELFAAEGTSSAVYVAAVLKLLKSWAGHSGERDIFGVFDKTRWTVGMVAQWSVIDALRVKLRARLAAEIRALNPDVIMAHSLGTLVAYDTLSHVDSRGKLGTFNGALVTLGAQVAHPAVADVFAGRVEMPPSVTRWWNLFNENDLVFTREFAVPPVGEVPKFVEVRTPFLQLPLSHFPEDYFGHDQARQDLWRPLMTGEFPGARQMDQAIGAARSVGAKSAKNAKALQAVAAKTRAELARPKLRALLVGIAEYANPEYQLLGPVNDVFRVSQTLQELGVEPDAIRVTLNERATAVAIRERLQWLLADTRDGDTVFFYFSGHGAQVPAYGRDAEVDHIDECLVPYDFNWQQGNAIFDDEFAALYSQLPYGAKFVAMFDCCHAGGMQRGLGSAAGASNARGIGIPDDIRHRALRWDRDTQMWLPREQLMRQGNERKESMQAAEQAQQSGKKGKLKASKTHANAIASGLLGTETKVEARLGESGTLRRIGRGQALRGDDAEQYNKRREAYDHKGPYMPILLEACTENQSAYEYQHGAVSYGAFTYGLCEALKKALDDSAKKSKKGRQGAAQKSAPSVTFEGLIAEAIRRVQFVASGPQTPQLVCPEFRRTQSVI